MIVKLEPLLNILGTNWPIFVLELPKGKSNKVARFTSYNLLFSDYIEQYAEYEVINCRILDVQQVIEITISQP